MNVIADGKKFEAIFGVEQDELLGERSFPYPRLTSDDDRSEFVEFIYSPFEIAGLDENFLLLNDRAHHRIATPHDCIVEQVDENRSAADPELEVPLLNPAMPSQKIVQILFAVDGHTAGGAKSF